MAKAPFKRVDKRKGEKRDSYNVPDSLDLRLLQDKVNKYCKTLEEDGSPKKPLTINGLKQLVRIAVRKKWMFSNTKLAFLNKMKVADTDPSSRTRFRIQCNICKRWFKEPEVEVDHREGEKEFTDLNKMLEWASSILDVKFEDLQMLCIPCHKIKSHQEASGLSFIEAGFDKQAIAICKAKEDKQWLEDRCVKPASNQASRRLQILEYLKEIQ